MLYDLGPRAGRVYQVLLDRIRSGKLDPERGFQPTPSSPRTSASRRSRCGRCWPGEADRLVVREHGRGTFVRGTDSAHVLVVAADLAERATLEREVRAAESGPC